MKVYISADIEGINQITAWEEALPGKEEYFAFKKQMTEEVKRATIAARKAGAEVVFVKDAHDEGRNIILSELPDYVVLHRGWEGSPEGMMEGLTPEFDAVMFIGYHSGMLNSGNSLSHTLSSDIQKITINGAPATEFLINSLYASTLNVPIAFLSGDEALTKEAKSMLPGLEVVATKTGIHGATLSRHPDLTNKEIEEKVFAALTKNFKNNLLPLPAEFVVEVEYRKHQEAYSASFYPKATLKNDYTVSFRSEKFYDVLTFFQFVL